MSNVRVIITDIEGTTNSINFVHYVLFPNACKHPLALVETHGDRPDVQHWPYEAAREAGLVETSRQEFIELLLHWIYEARKSAALKALQRMI